MSEYKASVIIPCKNRAELLFDCFRGLAEQSLGLDQFEVILVDDASPQPLDGVVERARRELGLTIRYQRMAVSHGPAPARNCGATIASAPILAFTDSDCRPHPDWLARGLAAFDEPSVGLVAGPCLPKPGQVMKLTSKDHFNTDEHPCYPTMNVFYPRAVFERLGGFDVSLCVRDPLGRAVEAADFDFAWQVIKAGYERRFIREAVVYHEVERLGLIGFILEGTRYFYLPEVVRRYPELRSEMLWARVFLKPGMWLIYSSLIIVILAIALQPWLVLLVPLLLLGRALIQTRSSNPALLWRFCVSACVQLPRNLVMSGALIYGSCRYRSLVL